MRATRVRSSDWSGFWRAADEAVLNKTQPKNISINWRLETIWISVHTSSEATTVLLDQRNTMHLHCTVHCKKGKRFSRSQPGWKRESKTFLRCRGVGLEQLYVFCSNGHWRHLPRSPPLSLWVMDKLFPIVPHNVSIIYLRSCHHVYKIVQWYWSSN